MELALNELKTQAKKLLKVIKEKNEFENKIKLQLKKIQITSPNEVKLKHCLILVAQQLGFENWHHAQLVLSGNATLTKNLDMGTVFYNNRCAAFINLWFSDYNQAKQALISNFEISYLLPYKKQFIVVKKEYLLALNINENSHCLFANIHHDLYQGYNTPSWDELNYQVIRNTQCKALIE